MKELFITVSFPGMPETTYRFERFPVRVGRSEFNDLSICHEAIPRELCTVWLEGDGRTVRVEERPGLNNPLLLGKTRITGGISREAADLTIGPCRLFLCAAKDAKKKSTRMKPVIATLSVLAAVLIIFAINGGDPVSSDHRVADLLPKSPFCDARTEPCDTTEACATRAHLLLTRAREMLLRPNLERSDRIHAAMMLTTAAGLQARVSPETARRIFQEVSETKVELTRQYQQDVLALKLALRQRIPESIHQAAVPVLKDLEICGGEPKEALETLVRHTGRKEP